MFRSRNTTSRAKAARELEREIMTMEVVSGDENEDSSGSWPADVPLPQRLAFGPYEVAPLSGLHFDSETDTVTS
jgi:hypothetical protein